MKRILIILSILFLCFRAEIFAQITATMESEKTYPNSTRICYFKTDKLLSEQAKEFLKQKAEENDKIIRLSFFNDNTVMFKADLDFTLDNVVNVINNEIENFYASKPEVEIFSAMPAPQRGIPQSICDIIKPACTDNEMEITFPADVNTSGYGKVGCLTTTPNPAWYYMQIGDPGNLNIYMTSMGVALGDGDIDFICWGPFNSVDDACAQINLTYCSTCPNNTESPNFYPYGNIVDCSYSANDSEYLYIRNAQPGQIYILLITNYDNNHFNINFHQISGNGSTDCGIVTPPVSSNSPLCEGETLQLTAQTSNVQNAVYNWTGPNGFTSNLQNPTIPNVTPANAGTYTLIISDGNINGDPRTINVIVNPLNYKTIDITLCKGEVYDLYGIPCSQTGTYITQIAGINCDTVVTLNLTIDNECNIVTFDSIYDICADYQQMTVGFTVANGTLTQYAATFNPKEIAAGFVNIPMHASSSNNIEIPLPVNVSPDYYSVTLDCRFERGENRVYVLDFAVLYPSSIITQRWNDILSVTNELFNGGFTFSQYEWYKNDVKIPNENGSYYYVGANGDVLDTNAFYRALITRTDDGVSLFTCGFQPYPILNTISPVLYPTLAVPNQPITVVVADGKLATIWDITGIKVAEYPLTNGTNTIYAPALMGTYILKIESNSGEQKNERILVK